jgi:hypothetical protein
MKLPPGPGAPSPDAHDAFVAATAACRAVSSFTAEVSLAGSIGGERVRARLVTGFASPASARLEAFAFGQPLFILAAAGRDATLLLTRDRRVLEHGDPADILEVLAGMALDAADLRETLLGCALAATTDSARRVGDDWRTIQTGAADIYLHRDARSAPWRLTAVVHHGAAEPSWRAEYRDFEGGLPRQVHLVSSERSRFDVRLSLAQVALDPSLPREAFEVNVPAGFDPISLDELRREGPFGGAGARGDGR